MITEHKTKAILFDLDGTLIDHFQAIYRTFLHVQEKMSLRNYDYVTIKNSVGASLATTLEDLYGKECVPEALPLFEKFYATIIHEDLVLLPGVHWLLNNLLEYDYTLALFTNKPTPYSKIICKTLEIDHHFPHIIGSNHANPKLKKPEKTFTEHALNTVNACPKTAALIGDSTFDIDAAHSVGMPIYSVTTGSHSKDDLLNYSTPPTRVFENLFDLGHSLFNFPIPKEIPSEISLTS